MSTEPEYILENNFISQLTGLGYKLCCVILSCWVFSSCSSSSLDDCETLFIQNLGITNETYALIQNEDRFLTDEEVEQFKAAYFGEGSMEGNKDWSTFEIIIDAYRNCRKTLPLNRFEVELIKSEILSAFQQDSIGFFPFYKISDSISAYQDAIRDTMELLNLSAISIESYDCRITSIIGYYYKTGDESVSRLRWWRKMAEKINIHNKYELLSYYYSVKMACSESKETSHINWNVPKQYFETVEKLMETYGESNIDNEFLTSIPHPQYEHYTIMYQQGHYRNVYEVLMQ